MEESKVRSRLTVPKALNAATACLVVFVSALSLVAGCTPKPTADASPIPVDPVPSASYVDLVLYFADDQAMEMLPERRRVEIPSDPAQRESTPVLVVKELLKGPQDPLLHRTLPPEAKLLSVDVANGVAHVNFSKEIQTKHWGGSTGEAVSLSSLVLSLTGLEPLTSSSAITKVQILVEGKKVETLAGHFDISGPLSRVVRTEQAFFTSKERVAELEERIAAGQDSWRRDPLEVARLEAPGRGLHPALEYKLVVLSRDEGKATVTTSWGGKDYTLLLAQPGTKGEHGFWVITEIVEE